MKKSRILMLGILLLAAMFLLTGCSTKATVEFTVDGMDAIAVVPVSTKNIDSYCKQEDINLVEPAKFLITFKSDGDYSFFLVDKSNNGCNLTIKLHNGQVEAETPEGVIVNIAVK